MLYLCLVDEFYPQQIDERISAKGIQRWLYLGEDSIWRIRAEKGLLRDVPRT